MLLPLLQFGSDPSCWIAMPTGCLTMLTSVPDRPPARRLTLMVVVSINLFRAVGRHWALLGETTDNMCQPSREQLRHLPRWGFLRRPKKMLSSEQPHTPIVVNDDGSPRSGSTQPALPF